MEIKKYNASNNMMALIRHIMRQLEEGKKYGNEDIDSELSDLNYSLIDRGKTVKEVNDYRKAFESKCFFYKKRKNIVKLIELVIQVPVDCPPEYHHAFFETVLSWYCDNYIGPAGKDAVCAAYTHYDEHKYISAFENGKKVVKDISKPHMHLLAIPCIEAGQKHPDFKYRLNADQLTKRSILKSMHPSLQKELKRRGIPGTVYTQKEGSGKTVKLTVSQLKDLTDKTGLTIDKPLTIDRLAEILNENQRLHSYELEAQELIETLKNENQQLRTELERSVEKDWGTSTWDNDITW